MQIGNIITAYTKGYHIITNITRRFYETDNRGRNKVGEEYVPLVTYRQIARNDFTPVMSRREFTCDMGYCSLVTPEDIEHIIHFIQVNGTSLIDMIVTHNGADVVR